MNESNPLHKILGATDIYLIDQIMKDRYQPTDIILDAGCGSGRNLHWFLQNNITIYGVDQQKDAIIDLKEQHPDLPPERFQQTSVEKLPFPNDYFHHVISSAVLHFAKNTTHFHQMMTEMVRVLKPRGSLFIRMTSDIGIENKVSLTEDRIYRIPDGSTRFLLTRPLLARTMSSLQLSFLEPLKTVNVNDLRCMSTLVLTKLS